jgi:hypothetical protein
MCVNGWMNLWLGVLFSSFWNWKKDDPVVGTG